MTLKSIFMATALSSMLSFSVHADPISHPADSSETQPRAERKDAYENMKTKAYAWSILGTLVPVGTAYLIANHVDSDHAVGVGWMAATGLFLGPSLGQFYAHSSGQAALGMGIRFLGGIMVVGGIAQALSSICVDLDYVPGDPGSQKHCPDTRDSNEGTPLILAGAFAHLGGTLYSLFDTGWAVDRYKHRASESQFGCIPTVSPGNGGTTRTGLSAWMRF